MLQTCDVDRVASEGQSSPLCPVFHFLQEKHTIEKSWDERSRAESHVCFYVSDLAYSKELAAMLIFIEKYIFDFKDSLKLPFSAPKLICNLNCLNSEAQD